MITTFTNLIVSAYCACSLCCGNEAHGITAIGKRPIQGVTVAIPRQFPLGSKVVINGQTFIGQDRYNKNLSTRIDVYFQSHRDAVAFGIKKLSVKIITPTNNKK